MKKEDFYKGQNVWVYLVGNASRGIKTVEERIQEWEVVSVGRKYITAKPKGDGSGWEQKFEIANNFRHVYKYGVEDYELYLSKEDILHDIKRTQYLSFIEKCCRWENAIHRKLSDEELETVVEIFRRYAE